MWIFHREMYANDADWMANSVDPDQTSRSSLIWVYTVCSDLSVRKFRNITVHQIGLFTVNWIQITTSLIYLLSFAKWAKSSLIWAVTRQNQQYELCAQQRLGSVWASAQSDQSSLSAWRNIGPLTTYWANAQADLSLRWAHMSFCCFCHAVAHMLNLKYPLTKIRGQ